ncbi:MAG: SDR family oxidoreductase [Saccharospirillum sp.]|uniref:UDP-glucose 4-epimerase family protein n=1 Tax=Saccharospirillum sp. TaxID=2033801 RepID=UPI003297D3F5
MRVLVTGSNGFLGSAVLQDLQAREVDAVGAVRKHQGESRAEEPIQVGYINAQTDWSEALKSVEAVVHCAARVHVMSEDADNALDAFREVNVEGTLNLARSAAAAGAKRFLFISSIKVNGEGTRPGRPFRHDDAPAPEDAYGQSKAEAEAGLLSVARETGLEVVVIRPPLVYGPGVKANFAALMKLAGKNLPLPLGAIRNKRSMVALENLVNLIVTCISHPSAANQAFLVSDDQDVSTTELLMLMTRATGKTPRLLPVPMSWLTLAAAFLDKKAIADRLFGSLQVDISHTKKTLGWVPPISVEQGIQRCFQQGE